MKLSTIGMIVWFGLYGINYFTKVSALGFILAITGIVVAIALCANN